MAREYTPTDEHAYDRPGAVYDRVDAPGDDGSAGYDTYEDPSDDGDARGFADLLKELRDESITLVRQEVALVKTELSEKATKVGRNVGYIVAGAGAGFFAAQFLLLALTVLIFQLLVFEWDEWPLYAAWIAPLIVGLVLAGLAGFLISKGIETLKNIDYTPTRTTESLKEDKQWLTDKIRG